MKPRLRRLMAAVRSSGRATDGSSPGRSAACRRTACRPYGIHALGGCAGGAPGGWGLGSRMAGNLGIPGGDCRCRGGRGDCARGGGAATLSAVVDSWPGHRRRCSALASSMCTVCGMDLSRRWRRTGRSCRPSWRFVLTLIGWPGRDRRSGAAVMKAATVRVEGRGGIWLVRAPLLLVVSWPAR